MSLTKRLMTDETGQSIVASLKALEAANGDFTGLSELEKQICTHRQSVSYKIL